MMPDRLAIRCTLFVLCLGLVAGCSAPAVKEPEPEARNPALASDLAEQGKLALDQGRKRAAEEAWRQAVELNPADAVVVNNLALLMTEAQGFQEAADLLERGLRYSPEVAELHYNLAVISELYLLDLEQALAHYRRYRELSETEDQQVAGWIADLERRLN